MEDVSRFVPLCQNEKNQRQLEELQFRKYWARNTNYFLRNY